jgi:hypothetical protein
VVDTAALPEYLGAVGEKRKLKDLVQEFCGHTIQQVSSIC